MSEPGDAREGHLDQAEFKKKMLSQLQTAGVVGQSQLRAQLLSALKKGQVVQLGPPPGDKPGLKRHALNSMIADYLAAVQYNYSLSVFKEESGIEARPLLTEDEVLDVLKVDRDASFYQSYMKSKAHAGPGSCVILNLLSAISEAAAAKGKESFTQTIGGDRYQLEVRMMQLENEYQSRLREARMGPGAGLEERLALYRQEIEEQAEAEVARQVERIREMEVAAARLDEASKARRAMEAERLELDRLHSERLTKLRQREEEMMDKLRRQQRDVENVAYEHRQRILREEERMRNQKTEMQQQLDARQEQLKQLERSLELRERAVAAREAAAEKKLAEATEVVAEAQVAARQDVEREYLELKNGVAQQRLQLEMDRARMQELRSEAMADLAAARAKDDRLRALETARAEAEARAAAHAADAEVCRLQAEKLALELNQARDELSRRVVQAAEGAEAMLQNAAGAMNMLNTEALASRHAGTQIREVVSQLERAKEEATAQVTELQQERGSLQITVAALGAEADALRNQLGRVEALLDEAVSARAAALSNLEESQFRAFQQERELSELRNALLRAKEELAALRMQLAMRRPPSRGPDSPGRRSITVSPTRRPPPGGGAAAISALSLGIALGGGPGGSLGAAGSYGSQQQQQQHHHHHQNQHSPPQHAPWHYHPSASGSMAGGTPALSNLEFPIAAVPRDPTQERLERLRRQEDIMARQEDTFRKRMAVLQEPPPQQQQQSAAEAQEQADEEERAFAYHRDQQIIRQQQQQQLQYYFSRPSPFQQHEHHQQAQEQQQQQYQDSAEYHYGGPEFETAQQQQLPRQHTPHDGSAAAAVVPVAEPSGPTSHSSSTIQPVSQPPQQQQQEHPAHISTRSTGHGVAAPPPQQQPPQELPYLSQVAGGMPLGAQPHVPAEPLAPPPPPPPPAGMGSPLPLALPADPAPLAPLASPALVAPPGLVFTSDLGTRAPASPAAEAHPPAAEPRKPTIPGLVIVSGFAPRSSPEPPQPPPPEGRSEELDSHSEPLDLANVMQAKMRMLQEQRERALAAQRQQQQQQHPPPLERRLSRNSHSSRYSGEVRFLGTTGGVGGMSMEASSPPGAGASGGLAAHVEDSTSDIVAGEEYDTVAPELSTLHRRGRRSHEGGTGHLSRQSSVSRRELVRGTSIARSEASALSMEVPGLGGPSMRALSTVLTLDDNLSSLEGFEVRGLDDDDDDGVEGPVSEGVGAFAAEFSANSVF
ncbi:basal body protein [Volvox carteri f. nagariensis]|uniref:Basal body protein n=1 Tax=Volvox carteri f. nagariensis TaxID=3068 RepID=D8TTK1_VOLCA|nr:basal body protein [Volvox carteri f. nagariensis]EFJ49212.1 basal body protein [Volvox carteri f. nagariensis]|eukprot:XP_002949660.1 basal body protein [Volvox carteri f. nagariensis]